MRDRALFLSALLAGLPQGTLALEMADGIVSFRFSIHDSSMLKDRGRHTDQTRANSQP